MADVATLSYATAPDGLRVCAFNPSPPGVFSFELGGFLPLVRRSFGPGARLADRAGTTDRGIETDAHAFSHQIRLGVVFSSVEFLADEIFKISG